MLDLIPIILTLAIFGAMVWLILQLPMPALFKQVIQVLAAIAALLWFLGHVRHFL